MWLKVILKSGADLLGDVVSDLKEAVCASSFRMDNSLWDTLTGEVSHFIHKIEILHEEWASRAG